MRILCGTDIIEIERIKKSIERSGSNFLNLIYKQSIKVIPLFSCRMAH